MSCSLTGKTKGLLGFWNDNTNEEYLLPNGDFFSTASTMSQVHHSFGQQCKPFCYDNFCRIKGDATSEGKWKTKTWCQTLENYKVKMFKALGLHQSEGLRFVTIERSTL